VPVWQGVVWPVLLWQVADADQVLCKHEGCLVRKVANLLPVPHQTFIAAKHPVMGERPG